MKDPMDDFVPKTEKNNRAVPKGGRWEDIDRWNEVKKKGSLHYRTGSIEPIDLLKSQGMLRDFALGNVIKYASRNRHGNALKTLEDMDKAIHYCEIVKVLAYERLDHVAKIEQKIKDDHNKKLFSEAEESYEEMDRSSRGDKTTNKKSNAPNKEAPNRITFE